jgi:ethanolamine utilization microcompartment shell protein EutS
LCDATLPASFPPRCRTGELHAPQPTSALALSSITTSLHSSKQQGDIALKAHVVSVCFKCFRGMLQVFYIDVAKVDKDVAHVAMVYTRMFQVYVPNDSSV